MGRVENDVHYRYDAHGVLLLGLRGTPLDRTPTPEHALPRHIGWADWCPLCMKLKQWVENKTKVKSG